MTQRLADARIDDGWQFILQENVLATPTVKTQTPFSSDEEFLFMYSCDI